MKKLIPLLLIFQMIVGCNGQQAKRPTRGQMYLGMSLPNAFLTYDKNLKRFPAKVKEELKGRCTTTVYQFWLVDDSQASNVFAKPSPYLLTFVGCRDENYEAIVAERTAKAEAILAANPQMAQEINKTCRDENITPENRIVLIELLYKDQFAGLPPRPALQTQLTQIEADHQTSDRISQQAYRQQQQRLQEQQIEEMQRQTKAIEEINNRQRLQSYP